MPRPETRRLRPLAAAMGVLAAASTPAWADGPATLRVTRTPVRLIDGVGVDVDAAALRNSSNLRLAVMPAGAPDAIADVAAFAEDSTRIMAARVRLTLPGGPAGADEVRLYHVPRFGTAFEVALRMPVTVLPGVPGAVLARDLGREAARLGPVRFEARYRDYPVHLQAQFLRVKPQTEWNVLWFGAVPLAEAMRHRAVVSLGTRGVVPDSSGSTNEVLCLMDVEDPAALTRVASLEPGDAVLVEGTPTTWTTTLARDPVLLRSCAFAP